MVKTWIKQLKIISNNSTINFDNIILDLYNNNFENYDIKWLSGYDNLYRLRIGTYRIIFQNIDEKVRILFIWKRWDVYKWLRKI